MRGKGSPEYHTWNHLNLPGVVGCASDAGAGEAARLGVQSHPLRYIHSEFKTSLGYISPCLLKKIF